MTYPELPRALQRKFQNTPLQMAIASLPDLAAEALAFELVNYSGLPQGYKDDDIGEALLPPEGDKDDIG